MKLHSSMYETLPDGQGRRRMLRGAASLIAIAALSPRTASAATRAEAPAAAPAAASPAASPARRTILVVGDSLSAEYGLRRGSGWVELLTERLKGNGKPFAVANASVSGETTAGGRTRIASLLERHRPAIVVIELGANDALRGLDLSATEANLREMIRAASKVGARPLLLGMMLPPNYGRAYGERFQALFPKLAKAEKVPLVPFFLDGVADRMEYFQSDRIHPNESAQPRLLENVWPALSKLL
jgi:acyl-CoA thioesterase-1